MGWCRDPTGRLAACTLGTAIRGLVTFLHDPAKQLFDALCDQADNQIDDALLVAPPTGRRSTAAAHASAAATAATPATAGVQAVLVAGLPPMACAAGPAATPLVSMVMLVTVRVLVTMPASTRAAAAGSGAPVVVLSGLVLAPVMHLSMRVKLALDRVESTQDVVHHRPVVHVALLGEEGNDSMACCSHAERRRAPRR